MSLLPPSSPRRCSNCGHEFPEGFDPSEAGGRGEGLNPRILLCLGVILLFTAAAVVYFMRLF